MGTQPSLVIGFDTTRTQAALRTVPECRGALGQMIASFPSGRMTDRLSAAVPLDSFLVSLSSLAAWPQPESVVWEEEFRVLVGEMLDTAETADRLLNGTPDEESISPEEVPPLLGGTGKGL